MADEEHAEFTASDAETTGAEEEPRADPEPSAVDAEAVVPENVGGDEERPEQKEQAVVPENMPPEMVDEQQPGAVGTDESGGVPLEPESGHVLLEESGQADTVGRDESQGVPLEPEYGQVPLEVAVELDAMGADESGGLPLEPESGRVPVEEAGQPDVVGPDESGGLPLEPESGQMPVEETGSPEDDTVQQPDVTEAEVVIPDVTDEETAAAELVEPQDIAASPTDDGLLEIVDDDYKDTVIGRPSDTEDEGMEDDELDKDLPQSSEQLADEPCEVMPYPSADDIDIIGEEPAKREAGLDELAEVDEGDEPDPTRVAEQVGPVLECPEFPLPPPLLLEGPEDIETPREEPTVPSVLVCFFLTIF